MKKNTKLLLIASGAVASISTANAALDAAVTTALTDAGTDVGTIGAAVLLVLVAVAAFRYVRKTL